jgi:hypothetical protein
VFTINLQFRFSWIYAFAFLRQNRLYYTARSLLKLNATVTSRLPAWTAWFTAKRYTVFQIQVKYRSIKTASSHLDCSSSCREPVCDGCVQLYQWTHSRKSSTGNKTAPLTSDLTSHIKRSFGLDYSDAHTIVLRMLIHRQPVSPQSCICIHRHTHIHTHNKQTHMQIQRSHQFNQ